MALPASCGDCPIAPLWPLCLLLMASSILGCEEKLCGEPEQPGLFCDSLCVCAGLELGSSSMQGAGCPIPALPAPTHCSCFEQISPKSTGRFLFVRRNVGEAWKAVLGLVRLLLLERAAVWRWGGCVWEVLPCISGKGLCGGLQPAPSLGWWIHQVIQVGQELRRFLVQPPAGGVQSGAESSQGRRGHSVPGLQPSCSLAS